MNLTEHFTFEEAVASSVAIRKGIRNEPNQEQIMNIHEAAEHLEEVRKLLGHPIMIDSWLRVPALNSAVGGSKTSSHIDGWAIDFTCPSFGRPLDIAIAIAESKINFDQLIQEGTWIHISFAPAMRRQILTARFNNGKVAYSQGLKL